MKHVTNLEGHVPSPKNHCPATRRQTNLAGDTIGLRLQKGFTSRSAEFESGLSRLPCVRCLLALSLLATDAPSSCCMLCRALSAKSQLPCRSKAACFSSMEASLLLNCGKAWISKSSILDMKTAEWRCSSVSENPPSENFRGES